MSFVVNAPAVVLAFASLVAMVVTVASWRRRRSPGGISFFIMMCAVTVWTLGAAFERAVIGIPAKLVFSVVIFSGIVNVAPSFLIFAIRYRRHEWRPSPWLIAFLWLIPAVTVVLAIVNNTHGLLWSSVTLSTVPGSTLAVYGRGPWYWIQIMYHGLLGLIAAAATIGAALARPQRIFVRQTVTLLIGLIIPWSGAALALLPINPFPGVDLPAVGFAFTGLLLLLGMARFRLFDLVPVARDILIETMVDGLVVLDARDRIVDMNPAARRLCNATDAAIGQDAREALGKVGEAFDDLRERGYGQREVAVSADPVRHLDLRASALRERTGSAPGWLLEIRDLTDRRQLELEREKLIAELRSALVENKTLSGLLPICSSCKRIRDDQGYWRTLERYITDHSAAQFSHGLCDECSRRLYPDLDISGSGPGTPGSSK